MNVAFYTLGCKTNQFETQALERLFTESGHEVVAFSSAADVYIVNTCTVTAISDKKSRAACRRCKKNNPNSFLIVCGCYSQLEDERVLRECGADAVLGSANKGRAVELAEGLVSGTGRGAKIVKPLPLLTNIPDLDMLPSGGLTGRTRALLKVQDGCRNFCSYCIIPYARGPCRSLPVERAESEAARLEREGYREIVITGIEISSYGEDLENTGLADLIARVCRAAGHTRIRLGSLEPRTVTEEFAALAASLPNLCPPFHLSLQSGCDKTLKMMNRRYDSARFYEACRTLRRHMPGCAITSDIIVGFPGESAEDCEQSLCFARRCKLAGAHIFPYSKRAGTPAASMPNQIAADEKQRRAAAAADVCGELRRTYLADMVGKTVSVLFEQAENGGYVGHTPQYCLVWAQGRQLKNRVLDVLITSSDGERLIGDIL